LFQGIHAVVPEKENTDMFKWVRGRCHITQMRAQMRRRERGQYVLRPSDRTGATRRRAAVWRPDGIRDVNPGPRFGTRQKPFRKTERGQVIITLPRQTTLSFLSPAVNDLAGERDLPRAEPYAAIVALT
jgi:hypothetical protein